VSGFVLTICFSIGSISTQSLYPPSAGSLHPLLPDLVPSLPLRLLTLFLFGLLSPNPLCFLSFIYFLFLPPLSVSPASKVSVLVSERLSLSLSSYVFLTRLRLDLCRFWSSCLSLLEFLGSLLRKTVSRLGVCAIRSIICSSNVYKATHIRELWMT
jgi:hypothetical protein